MMDRLRVWAMMLIPGRQERWSNTVLRARLDVLGLYDMDAYNQELRKRGLSWDDVNARAERLKQRGY